MAKLSCGILVYKFIDQQLSVLLAHPAGPVWSKLDRWTIPKGEVEPGESLLTAAKREFLEEVGVEAPNNKLLDLGIINQSLVKDNHIWAVTGEVDVGQFRSNLFSMEWPPNSGKIEQFPENDKVAWWEVNLAKIKIFPSQCGFIERLEKIISS